MGLFSSIIVGILAGWIASKIMKTDTGMFRNMLLGIVGGIVGGWIASLITGVDLVTGFNLTSVVVSVLGAVVVIALYRLITGKRA
jgi:uncharacterized membrane protein YeaQ/YmgE (transglycosylase-associated protein family)